MRTIKFRGIDIETGQWVDGDLIQYKGYLPNIHFSYMSNDKLRYGQCVVKKETVGQFAELYDKHDDEIYDGDFILSDKDNKVYYVTFKNGMFYASCHECNPNLHGGYSLWMVVNMGCSIIGNIHDNPELLKGGEK